MAKIVPLSNSHRTILRNSNRFLFHDTKQRLRNKMLLSMIFYVLKHDIIYYILSKVRNNYNLKGLFFPFDTLLNYLK